jgi:hypothetical protein
MRKDSVQLWLELEEAHLKGFIRRMEEVSEFLPNQTGMRVYGTRIWFHRWTPSKHLKKIGNYIRSAYNLKVNVETSFSLIVWDHPEI